MEREKFEALASGVRKTLEDSRAMFREMSAKRVVDDDYLERIKPEAKRLLRLMTCFLQTDLYHLLGMGRLSATQMSSLRKMTCEVSRIKKRVQKAAEYRKGNQIARFRGETRPVYRCHCGDVLLEGVIRG